MIKLSCGVLTALPGRKLRRRVSHVFLEKVFMAAFHISPPFRLINHGIWNPFDNGQDAQTDLGRFQRRRLLSTRCFLLRCCAGAASGTQG